MHDVGELLGQRYALQRRLAVGGTGEVWCAEDRMLGRLVAVKLPRPDGTDDGFAERLLAEARHAAAVRHPGIAAVYDVSGVAPVPYLVLELVDGQPLSARLHEHRLREHRLHEHRLHEHRLREDRLHEHGPLTAEQTRDLLVQVADALAAAHAAGLVHRDVKPGNLLLADSGTVKVTDFGIARAVDADPTTRTGFVVGTALYLSPEQAAGATATPASDLYALGVVAYECLTGQRPFEGEPLDVLRAHRDDPVPPLPAHVPADLRELVLALLDKDPARRPTAAQVARRAGRPLDPPTAMLPVVAAGPAQPASASTSGPPGRPLRPAWTPALRALPGRSRPGVVAGAALAVLMLVVLAAVVATRSGSGGTTSARAAPAATAAPPAVLPVTQAQLFHPGGSGEDNPGQVPLTVDGNPATAWTTQYYATADFGRLRPGVGIMLDLGQGRSVQEVRILLATPGLTLTVHAGTAPGDGLLGAPVIGRVTGAPGTTVVRATAPVQARYVLVWIERLPAAVPHQATVQEISVLG